MLHGYLHEQGLNMAAQARQPLLRQGYSALLSSAPLAQPLTALDEWPQQWREAASSGELRGLHRLIGKRLRKDRQRFAAGAADPAMTVTACACWSNACAMRLRLIRN